jgi:sugar O-acyltransferase (sialic acid O-acetyltransferase NeuD family)
MDKPVVIFGAKGAVHTVLDTCNAAGRVVYCLLDDDEALHDQEVANISVMGNTEYEPVLNIIGNECGAFVALEDKEERKSITEHLIKRKKDVPVNIIHPKASVSGEAWLGHGLLLAANVCVESSAKLAGHSLLMPNVVVSRETEVGEYVYVGAGSTIGAGAKIGDGVHLGQNVTVVPGVTIGKNVQVGHGSVVLTDIEEGKIVFGVPAKVL